MQISKLRGLKEFLLIIGVFIITLFVGGVEVKALEDPAVGTASQEIENMIAHGKSIIGKTPYVLGGGHGNWDSQKNKDIPDGLDCSSFVTWTMYRGMGVLAGGGVQATRVMRPYYDEVGKGSLDNAKRGDLVWTPGHVEIYLGKNSSGDHITLHAQNSRKDIGITKAYWGQGLSSARVLRINMEDAKAGKNGLSYDSSRIVDVGVRGVSKEEGGTDAEQSGEMAWGEFDEEMLFQWLDPIVDFKGSSNTHSKSDPGEKTSESKSKGLKGNKGGIFSGIFGK